MDGGWQKGAAGCWSAVRATEAEAKQAMRRPPAGASAAAWGGRSGGVRGRDGAAAEGRATRTPQRCCRWWAAAALVWAAGRRAGCGLLLRGQGRWPSWACRSGGQQVWRPAVQRIAGAWRCDDHGRIRIVPRMLRRARSTCGGVFSGPAAAGAGAGGWPLFCLWSTASRTASRASANEASSSSSSCASVMAQAAVHAALLTEGAPGVAWRPPLRLLRTLICSACVEPEALWRVERASPGGGGRVAPACTASAMHRQGNTLKRPH